MLLFWSFKYISYMLQILTLRGSKCVNAFTSHIINELNLQAKNSCCVIAVVVGDGTIVIKIYALEV